LQHKLVGFYNRDGKCLQRGTDWVFKLSSLRFVFKGLKDIVAFVLHVTYITLLLNTNDKKLRKNELHNERKILREDHRERNFSRQTLPTRS